MSGRESVREWVVVYLKGICMGAADAVPGVSGGTIALIVGIYERLIRAITALDPGVIRYLPRLGDAGARADLKRDLSEMDIAFLFVLGAGIATAVVSVAGFMHLALTEYPGPTNAFFFGLIAASAIVLYEHVSLDTARRIAVAIFGFVLAFVVTDPSINSALGHSPLVVFFAGAIAISAMILPGISGAFLLYILGQYKFLSGTLTTFTTALVAVLGGGSFVSLLAPGATILTFGVGALVGLFSISYAIRWALSHYREATLTFLVSLMVGALRLPALKVLRHTPDVTPMAIGSVLVVAIVGGALVLLVDWFTDDIEFA